MIEHLNPYIQSADAIIQNLFWLKYITYQYVSLLFLVQLRKWRQTHFNSLT